MAARYSRSFSVRDSGASAWTPAHQGRSSGDDQSARSDPAPTEARFEAAAQADHFEFAPRAESGGRDGGTLSPAEAGRLDLASVGNDGRPDTPPVPDPDPEPVEDRDPDPAPPPVDPAPTPDAPTQNGRPVGDAPGTPQVTPPSPAPGDDNAGFGRPADATPGPLPDGPLTSYTSGGPAASSFNVTVEFIGTWSIQLQQAFIDAADYISSIILGDLPDTVANGVAIDDITITATLAAIDGVGGTLGSAGPRVLRDDGSFLPATGAMTFDVEDAQNQFDIGNWGAIVLHEMMHPLGYGTLWSLMGLTSGSVANGDIRFIGENAVSVYGTEFPDIAAGDPGSAFGIPVEEDGGPGTAGGHWDEELFDQEIMTGFIDSGAFVSVMTIASFEDMGYDTVFDSPFDPNDLSGSIPPDPLLDVFV
mmetsp:Transcript_27437/g.50561  ORF Transcript_27437/g.50561 Transcript_27437/m.50561 type:complete len:419 (+) Transcript_27437:3347-4603(+)